MPINLPNGANVEEIVLPNGSNASEVLGPDGSTVWERVAIPDSAVARWTFDDKDTDSGTAIDIWNGYDGTINGATTGVSGANQTYDTGQAYDFDGSNDYVAVGNQFEVATGSFSVAFWLNYDSTSDLRPISKLLNASEGGFSFYENDGFRFWIDGDVVEESSPSTSSNTWYHFVCVLDTSDNTGYIYKDGSEIASNTQEALGTDDGEFEIGAIRTGSNSNYADATVDDVRIYSKALSPTEVSGLYNTGSI